MLINVRTIPNAKKVNIKEDFDSLKIYLTRPAIEGKANKLLIEVLAERFKVRKSAIRIVRGEKSRNKLVNIDGL